MSRASVRCSSQLFSFGSELFERCLVSSGPWTVEIVELVEIVEFGGEIVGFAEIRRAGEFW